MRIESIKLQNFRNIEWAELSFNGQQHFFVGANAQGKTNLLEAIGLATALRSFRTQNDLASLIKMGAREARLCLLIDHEKLGKTELEIHLTMQSRHVFLDGQKVQSWADFLGKFLTVVFASEDRQWVLGAPALRRKWLDTTISCLNPCYFDALRRYSKSLASRNRLLKTQGSEAVLQSMGRVMAKDALTLMDVRKEHMHNLAKLFSEAYGQLTEGREKATMEYRVDAAVESAHALEALWMQQFAKDTLYGQTHKGPHRDDIAFTVDAKPVRDFASEGQQRSVVLAMRLAQMLYMQSKLGIAPVILADDVLNELDESRQRRFWNLVPAGTQLLATATVFPQATSIAQIWQVCAGTFDLQNPASILLQQPRAITA